MILVTGATGHIGRRVAGMLAQGGHQLRLMARDPAKAPRLPNTTVMQGDFADPASLGEVFANVDRAFIVSGYAEPGERAKLHGNAFQAAAQAGVRHLVYLSFQGAAPDSRFPMSRDHHQSEQLLKASGVPFTALRDCFYQELIPEMVSNGVMRGPGRQGSVAWVSRDDVASVVAAALERPGEPGGAVDVTGPESITLAQTMERLSRIVNRLLRYENEAVEDGRRWRAASNAPAWQVDAWLGSYEAIAAGEVARASDTVRRLTGNNPLRLEQCFAAHPELLDSLRPPAGS